MLFDDDDDDAEPSFVRDRHDAEDEGVEPVEGLAGVGELVVAHRLCCVPLEDGRAGGACDTLELDHLDWSDMTGPFSSEASSLLCDDGEGG